MKSHDYNEGFTAGIVAAESIAFDLEQRWRASAQKTRQDGTWNTGWPWYKSFVARKWEEAAKSLEAAADGIKAIRDCIVTIRPED